MHDRRRALLNASSIMRIGQCSSCPAPSKFFHDNFDGEMEFVRSWSEMKKANASAKQNYLDIFINPNRGDIIVGGVCHTYLAFSETGGIKRPHVLIAGINENWGEFSTPVPNRTVDWGEWRGHFKRNGCQEEDLWAYLDHENVSAVFTTTHQFLDHPKVFSVPLGVKGPDILIELQQRMDAPNRTELLVINHGDFQHRPAIAKSVIANFNGTIENGYRSRGGKDEFRDSLRHAKFVLAPSGLGWDTYRAWEALALGTIPVLERYYRKDGFHRTFDFLPVLWVDHFDNVTPALLTAEYPRIVSRAREYRFEKLTNWWWVDLINSYRERPGRLNIPPERKDDNTEQDKSESSDTLSPEAAAAAPLVRPSESRSGESVSGAKEKKQPELPEKSLEFPPSIDVCDATKTNLSFDEGKMVLKHLSTSHIPTNGTRFAYGPWITKSGSTTMQKTLKQASDEAPSLDVDVLSDETLDQYEFLSVLRHPMERALAGFHQVEVFWLMNWIDGPIDRLGLRWWNETCLSSLWGAETKAAGKFQCRGSKPETTVERRLQRLNNFLEELDEKGFWDEHIAPISYILSKNRLTGRAKYFDIKHIDQVTGLIAASAGKPNATMSSMKRGHSDSGMDWVVRWKELVELSPDFELARSAIKKLCRLYRSDIECLPYDVSECNHK